jgi:hypothetical protein
LQPLVLLLQRLVARQVHGSKVASGRQAQLDW